MLGQGVAQLPQERLRMGLGGLKDLLGMRTPVGVGVGDEAEA